MTTVINLIGGPGCGKSTVAAKLYAEMKEKKYNVEMVREVAKEWAWEGKKIGPFQQLAIIGEQMKKESSLFNQVEYVVTDSPVLLGSFYFQHNHKEMFMFNAVHNYYKFCKRKNVKFLNYVLPRRTKYDPRGRYETLDQAKQIDKFLLEHSAVLFGAGMHVFNRNMSNKGIIRHILKDLK